MTGAQRGFLLLCCHLGSPDRRPLTPAQFRKLSRRVRDSEKPAPDRELETARRIAGAGELQPILDFFKELEILTPHWEARLASPEPGPWEDSFRAIGRYFLRRYWLQAVSDLDLMGRAKLTVISCLVIRALGGSVRETAQLYSKEIENSASNLDALLDAAYTHPALTDDKLLGLLLGRV